MRLEPREEPFRFKTSESLSHQNVDEDFSRLKGKASPLKVNFSHCLLKTKLHVLILATFASANYLQYRYSHGEMINTPST